MFQSDGDKKDGHQYGQCIIQRSQEVGHGVPGLFALLADKIVSRPKYMYIYRFLNYGELKFQ